MSLLAAHPVVRRQSLPRRLRKMVLVSAILCAAGGAAPVALGAQTEPDACEPGTAPGTSRLVTLPSGYQLELLRAADSVNVETGCMAILRNARDAVVWKKEGFQAAVDEWTGRDVDNDGAADAVIAVETGGGNRCCWTLWVLRFRPRFQVLGQLSFPAYFDRDARGRTLIWEVMPFYDLGASLAESPTVIRAHQWRSGRRRDVTKEVCDHILNDRAQDLGTRATEWELASPERLVISREAEQVLGDSIDYEILQTRGAAASLALQFLACEQPDEARRLVDAAWPVAHAAARWEELREAFSKRMKQR